MGVLFKCSHFCTSLPSRNREWIFSGAECFLTPEGDERRGDKWIDARRKMKKGGGGVIRFSILCFDLS